jgi:hypothetical protein
MADENINHDNAASSKIVRHLNETSTVAPAYNNVLGIGDLIREIETLSKNATCLSDRDTVAPGDNNVPNINDSTSMIQSKRLRNCPNGSTIELKKYSSTFL